MLNETYLTARWQKNPVRCVLSIVVFKMLMVWRELWINSGLNALMHTGIIIVSVLAICIELIFAVSVRSEGKQHWRWVVLFAIVLVEMWAVAMFMPEGRETYLYPVWYTNDVLLLFYVIEHLVSGKESQKKK